MQRQNNPNLMILELAVNAFADDNEWFLEAILGHLPGDAANQWHIAHSIICDML
jgi:hypothetical protein